MDKNSVLVRQNGQSIKIHINNARITKVISASYYYNKTFNQTELELKIIVDDLMVVTEKSS